jgi:hypothetical protein
MKQSHNNLPRQLQHCRHLLSDGFPNSNALLLCIHDGNAAIPFLKEPFAAAPRKLLSIPFSEESRHVTVESVRG